MESSRKWLQQELSRVAASHTRERCRGMRLCGRRRGLCGSRQFSVNSNQSLRRKPAVPSTVFPVQNTCRLQNTPVCCLAWEKNRSKDRPLPRIRNGLPAGKAGATHALENCTLCRGTGWKMCRGRMGGGKVACGVRLRDEERASRAMERAKDSEALRALRF